MAEHDGVRSRLGSGAHRQIWRGTLRITSLLGGRRRHRRLSAYQRTACATKATSAGSRPVSLAGGRRGRLHATRTPGALGCSPSAWLFPRRRQASDALNAARSQRRSASRSRDGGSGMRAAGSEGSVGLRKLMGWFPPLTAVIRGLCGRISSRLPARRDKRSPSACGSWYD